MASTDFEVIIKHVRSFMIISQSCENYRFSNIAFLQKLSLFKDCPLYNKQKNTWVLGNTRFISRVEHDISLVRYHVQHVHSLFQLTTLNISIPTIDCAIICKTVMFLEFYVFGERVIGWVRGGGGRNISSPLRGVLNSFRRFWGGCQILW
jgi:hypothetical protein